MDSSQVSLLDGSLYLHYNTFKTFSRWNSGMNASMALVSPKQVARAIGVSESSLKRWCDQGLIKTVRTAGGHRKIRTADVLDYIRESEGRLIVPEALGLPPVSPGAASGLRNAGLRLVEALLAGDESLARHILLNLYLARHSIGVICDEVIAIAFREIGNRWASHDAAIYQERRACEISLRGLFDLRNLQPVGEVRLTAMGGTIEGDQYTLPTAMVELVLNEVGYQSSSLGTSIPMESMIRAVREAKPGLFWLSVSFIRDGLDFLTEFAELSHACRSEGVPLVVGGRALTETLRHRMIYSAYCDNMQHLEAFAKTLVHSKRRRPRRKTSAKPRASHPLKREGCAQE